MATDTYRNYRATIDLKNQSARIYDADVRARRGPHCPTTLPSVFIADGRYEVVGECYANDRQGRPLALISVADQVMDTAKLDAKLEFNRRLGMPINLTPLLGVDVSTAADAAGGND